MYVCMCIYIYYNDKTGSNNILVMAIITRLKIQRCLGWALEGVRGAGAGRVEASRGSSQKGCYEKCKC